MWWHGMPHESRDTCMTHASAISADAAYRCYCHCPPSAICHLPSPLMLLPLPSLPAPIGVSPATPARLSLPALATLLDTTRGQPLPAAVCVRACVSVCVRAGRRAPRDHPQRLRQLALRPRLQERLLLQPPSGQCGAVEVRLAGWLAAWRLAGGPAATHCPLQEGALGSMSTCLGTYICMQIYGIKCGKAPCMHAGPQRTDVGTRAYIHTNVRMDALKPALAWAHACCMHGCRRGRPLRPPAPPSTPHCPPPPHTRTSGTATPYLWWWPAACWTTSQPALRSRRRWRCGRSCRRWPASW